jgi:hypothetical protein
MERMAEGIERGEFEKKLVGKINRFVNCLEKQEIQEREEPRT